MMLGSHCCRLHQTENKAQLLVCINSTKFFVAEGYYVKVRRCNCVCPGAGKHLEEQVSPKDLGPNPIQIWAVQPKGEKAFPCLLERVSMTYPHRMQQHAPLAWLHQY